MNGGIPAGVPLDFHLLRAKVAAAGAVTCR